MSPIEWALLEGKPCPIIHCPHCGREFKPFMRGEIQRSANPWWRLFRARDYCALICAECKNCVGWESP